jgi:hypothetical protein
LSGHMTLLEMIDVGGWLDEVDLRAFDDPESNKEMARTFAALDYARTKMAADFDASGAWASSGAKTAAAWLSTTNRTPLNESRGLVRRGRRLRHLPYFEEAWAAGLITAAHIDVVARVRRPATEWALARDEPLLVEQAKTLQFRDFVRVIAYWELHADPIGAEEAAERAIDGRDVYLTPSLGGIFLGRITLDPISGAQVHGELARIVNELYQADHTEAADRLGRSPKVDELRRTNRQRWADALVEMAVRSGTAPANGRRPEPLFSVMVNHEALIGPMCQMAQSGIVLPPGSLLRWLEQADFERAVFLPGRGKRDVALLHRSPAPRPRVAGSRMRPSLLRHGGRPLPGRPHHRMAPGRFDQPRERQDALRLPQSTAQPETPTAGGIGSLDSSFPVVMTTTDFGGSDPFGTESPNRRWHLS